MKKKWIALLLALGMAASVFTGCSPASQTGKSTAEGPNVYFEELTEEKKEENAMIFAANIDGQTDKVYFDNVWMNRSKFLGGLVFQGLFIAEDNINNIRPDICEDYVISPDGTGVVFTIRDDIWWQDGEKLTVEDVVWSIETFLKVPETNGLIGRGLQSIKGAKDWIEGEADAISGIRTEKNTLYIQTENEYSTLLSALGQLAILPKHCFAEVPLEEFSNCSFWKFPIGSGPYKVVSSTEKEIVLEPFDRYVGQKPQIAQIRYKVLENPETDDFDFALTTDPDIINKYRTKAGYKTLRTNHLYYRYLFFNLDGRKGENAQLLKDEKVRRALLCGLDRRTIVNNLYKGSAEVLTTGIPQDDSWHVDRDVYAIGYRPSEAKRLLEEADFDFDKTLVLTRYSTDELSVKLLEEVAKNWNALGIKTEIVPVETDSTNKLFVEADWYDVALKNLAASGYDEWYYEYSSENNLWSVVNKQTDFDRLIQKMGQAEWAYEKKDLYADLQKKESERVYKIPIAMVSQNVIYNEDRLKIPEMEFPNLWYYFDLKLEQWRILTPEGEMQDLPTAMPAGE